MDNDAKCCWFVQSPWLSSDHHFKAELGFIPVSVHENEPSSVAAFALSSFEYRNKLAELNKTSQGKLLRSSEDEDLVRYVCQNKLRSFAPSDTLQF